MCMSLEGSESTAPPRDRVDLDGRIRPGLYAAGSSLRIDCHVLSELHGFPLVTADAETSLFERMTGPISQDEHHMDDDRAHVRSHEHGTRGRKTKLKLWREADDDSIPGSVRWDTVG